MGGYGQVSPSAGPLTVRAWTEEDLPPWIRRLHTLVVSGPAARLAVLSLLGHFASPSIRGGMPRDGKTAYPTAPATHHGLGGGLTLQPRGTKLEEWTGSERQRRHSDRQKTP